MLKHGDGFRERNRGGKNGKGLIRKGGGGKKVVAKGVKE